LASRSSQRELAKQIAALIESAREIILVFMVAAAHGMPVDYIEFPSGNQPLLSQTDTGRGE
jgi:hypothetical protein